MTVKKVGTSGLTAAMKAAAVGVMLLAIVSVAVAAVHPLRKFYESAVNELAQRHGVEANLVHAIILAESNYNYRAVSVKGAVGLMQLMPSTARVYGVKDSFNYYQNIEGGIKYLKDLIKLFNGTTRQVLAAYNAGQEAVKKFNGMPPYAETKQYINRVMASYPKENINGFSRGQVVTYYDEKTGRMVMTNFPNTKYSVSTIKN